MKRFPIFVIMAGVMMLVFGACGNKSTPADRTSTVVAENAPKKADVKIVYNSPIAAGKPAFANDPSHHGPLKMSDGRMRSTTWADTVSMGDYGAFTMNGRRQISVSMINYADEDLIVDSILVPDSRFEVEWGLSREKMPPQLLTGITLYGDNIEALSDYKIVIVYRNDSIPPQTLHFNIHPDIYKLHADYAASQQQQQ